MSAIVGANGDAHVYEPKPDDARMVATADIVFVNGLGFEGWLDRLMEASGGKDKIVTLSNGIVNHTMTEDGGASIDPHAWQSVPNARIYVKNIAEALCAKDAEGCSGYKANAAAYDQELAALDASIRQSFAAIPVERRLVITSHDAFGYFAREYSVKFLAPEGINTESEASARDVAKLISQIRALKASALFVENISDPRLIEQIANETGVTPGGALYSDALSDAGGTAPTYIDMMKHNAALLAAAMQGS